jgi:hypothetical protein
VSCKRSNRDQRRVTMQGPLLCHSDFSGEMALLTKAGYGFSACSESAAAGDGARRIVSRRARKSGLHRSSPIDDDDDSEPALKRRRV